MTNDEDPQQVQVERMLPHQVEAAIAARSVVYLPLGSIEFHSHHLPLGLDGLTAHGICTRPARQLESPAHPGPPATGHHGTRP